MGRMVSRIDVMTEYGYVVVLTGGECAWRVWTLRLYVVEGEICGGGTSAVNPGETDGKDETDNGMGIESRSNSRQAMFYRSSLADLASTKPSSDEYALNDTPCTNRRRKLVPSPSPLSRHALEAGRGAYPYMIPTTPVSTSSVGIFYHARRLKYYGQPPGRCLGSVLGQ